VIKLSSTPSWNLINPSGAEIEEDQIFSSVSLAAPYTELIEEFTLSEAIQFQRRFMRFQEGVDDSLITSWLPFGKRKLIREFSSGMKQRLKLVLAICADSDLLLLDEPTSNLDKQGQEWYRELLDQFSEDRLIFIASNEEAEYSGFVSRQIDITEFKQARKF
jgi:ABC-type multidrug transport system ATPase subunit